MRCLNGLAQQDVDPGLFEVVVVADSCTDETAREVTARRLTLPFRCTLLTPYAHHAATARNHGAAAAQGRVLLFLDDDMDPLPGLLDAHLSGHSDHDVVLGYAKPRLLSQPTRWQLGARLWWEDRFDTMGSDGHQISCWDFFSGNFSVRRDLFLEVGGFDDSLPRQEDYELGARLLEAGARVRFRPDALTYHLETSDVSSWIERGRDDGKSQLMMWKKHPHLGRELAGAESPLRKRWVGALRSRKRILLAGIPGSHSLIAIARALLFPLERIKARGLWRFLSAALYEWSYWNGVAENFRSRSELLRWLQERELEIAPVALHAGHVSSGRIAEYFPDQLTNLLALPASAHPRALHTASFAGAGLRELVRILKLPAEVSVLDIARDITPFGMKPETQSLLILLARERRALGLFSLTPRLEGAVRLDEYANDLVSSQITALADLHSPIREDAGDLAEQHRDPRITVVVCTRDRPAELYRCLRSLSSLAYPEYEVVVVDSGSSDPESVQRVVASFKGFRVIREEASGLDLARNRGIVESRGEIVAFLDDDAVAHIDWLRGVAEGFSDPEVSALTGLVLPAELETEAQRDFELYGGMGKGFRPRMIRKQRLEPRKLLQSQSWGVGTNMAFRRRLLDSTGPFDPDLDVGTPASGGGDIEFFHRLVSAGHTLRYEPAAIVFHYHRREPKDLRRQIFHNGRSFPAYLQSVFSRSPELRRAVVQYGCSDWGVGWLVRNLVGSLLWLDGRRLRLSLAESMGAAAWLASNLIAARRQPGVKRGG